MAKAKSAAKEVANAVALISFKEMMPAGVDISTLGDEFVSLYKVGGYARKVSSQNGIYGLQETLVGDFAGRSQDNGLVSSRKCVLPAGGADVIISALEASIEKTPSIKFFADIQARAKGEKYELRVLHEIEIETVSAATAMFA